MPCFDTAAKGAECVRSKCTQQHEGVSVGCSTSTLAVATACQCCGTLMYHLPGNLHLRGMACIIVHHSYSCSHSALTNHFQSLLLLLLHSVGSYLCPGIPSGWHIEGRGLSQGRLYSLTPQHSLSNHAHSLDASQCSDAPMALKPGTLWSVITASEPYQDLDLYAKLVAEVSVMGGWGWGFGGGGGLVKGGWGLLAPLCNWQQCAAVACTCGHASSALATSQ